MKTITREEFMANPKEAFEDGPVGITDDDGKVKLIVCRPTDRRDTPEEVIEALRARVSVLESALSNANGNYVGAREGTKAAIDRALAAEKALAWYAAEETYRVEFLANGESVSRIEMDRGERARAALGLEKKP